MSDNRRERQELLMLKERLEKYCGKEDDAGAEEAITDILNILNGFNMTVQLLEDTRIGQTLGDLMKKYGEADIALRTKKLLKKWKKELKPATESRSVVVSSISSQIDGDSVIAPPSVSTAVTDGESKSALTRASSEGDGSWGFEEDFAKLDSARLAVRLIFIL